MFAPLFRGRRKEFYQKSRDKDKKRAGASKENIFSPAFLIFLSFVTLRFWD